MSSFDVVAFGKIIHDKLIMARNLGHRISCEALAPIKYTFSEIYMNIDFTCFNAGRNKSIITILDQNRSISILINGLISKTDKNRLPGLCDYRFW